MSKQSYADSRRLWIGAAHGLLIETDVALLYFAAVKVIDLLRAFGVIQ